MLRCFLLAAEEAYFKEKVVCFAAVRPSASSLGSLGAAACCPCPFLSTSPVPVDQDLFVILWY